MIFSTRYLIAFPFACTYNPSADTTAKETTVGVADESIPTLQSCNYRFVDIIHLISVKFVHGFLHALDVAHAINAGEVGMNPAYPLDEDKREHARHRKLNSMEVEEAGINVKPWQSTARKNSSI